MFRKCIGWSCLLLCCGIIPRCAIAQLDQLSANDKDFIEYAGEFNLTWVRMGSLAETRSARPEVRALGKTLAMEHNGDLKKLAVIANKTGGVAPNSLDDVHAEAMKKLMKRKGEDFDHQFLKMVVNEHENALVSVKREADHGASPELQAYARALLPHLEKHLKQARKLDYSAE